MMSFLSRGNGQPDDGDEPDDERGLLGFTIIVYVAGVGVGASVTVLLFWGRIFGTP